MRVKTVQITNRQSQKQQHGGLFLGLASPQRLVVSRTDFSRRLLLNQGMLCQRYRGIAWFCQKPNTNVPLSSSSVLFLYLIEAPLS